MNPRITGLHTSDGGVPKLPAQSLEIVSANCIGDKLNDLEHHGGIDKAVCLFQQEIIDQLNSEGHPINAGSTGENILIHGIPIGNIYPGVIIKFPSVELIITQDAPPCKTIKDSFKDGYFNAISHKKKPHYTRWYARVIKEGVVSVDDSVSVELIS